MARCAESRNVVCNTCLLEGPHEVRLGRDNVLHPMAKLRALSGPICVGDRNVFEEHAEVVNELPPGSDGKPQVLRIGSSNLLEPGCSVKARVVGDGCTLRTRCSVGIGAELGDDSVVGVRRVLRAGAQLAAGTVLWGPSGELRQCPDYQQGRPSEHRADHDRSVKNLQSQLPLFHHTRDDGFTCATLE
eukprot:TRINITY_DN12529_c0_g1_i2.p1 TRINITY_DN12529_c0_g1~~TRINITY_DN12529_c0_g1_i2.p1  ORF type:complete len:221 (+),score=54.40 TRINITY_DN12529_c0_g1_i2:100-663(+)